MRPEYFAMIGDKTASSADKTAAMLGIVPYFCLEGVFYGCAQARSMSAISIYVSPSASRLCRSETGSGVCDALYLKGVISLCGDGGRNCESGIDDQ